jgi:antitoxin component YwqK of YwqJK toxin-antitoxin module
MAETIPKGGTRPMSHWAACLDWGFRSLLVICAWPSLFTTFACIVVFGHDPPGLMRAMWGCLPGLLACVVLMLPWRLLFRSRLRMTLALASACVAAHQVYGSFGTWQTTLPPTPRFVFCCLVLVLGGTSLALYLHRARRKVMLVAPSMALVLVCFVFGSGDPQWSRWIFVWQVHYSPWRIDPGNLPTNRSEPRLRLPKYTEWDARGRKSGEWSHPNGELLRTEYYPDGQKRMESLRAEDQFLTRWYPDGRMEFQYDRATRRKRAWDPNGNPREGEVASTFPGTDKVQSVCHYKNGYFDGVHRYWYPHGNQLMYESHYRDGRMDGVVRNWNNEGGLVTEESYADGYRHGPRRRFLSDGSLDWEETYAAGVLQGERKMYPKPAGSRGHRQ